MAALVKTSLHSNPNTDAEAGRERYNGFLATGDAPNFLAGFYLYRW